MTERKVFQFPINETKDLLDLEETLSTNPIFRKEFIEQFSKITFHRNRSHQMNYKYAYLIIDEIFDRELLAKYSWSGFMRSTQKMKFANFKAIITAFQEILVKKDSKYTLKLTTFFLSRRLLRNSTSRYKRLSTKKKCKKLSIEEIIGKYNDD